MIAEFTDFSREDEKMQRINDKLKGTAEFTRHFRIEYHKALAKKCECFLN